MLKCFVYLLLLAGGISASYICIKPNSCPGPKTDIYSDLPQTVEEFKKKCRFNVEYLDCILPYFEVCTLSEFFDSNYTNYLSEANQNFMSGIREICSEDNFLYEDIVDNFECFKETVSVSIQERACDVFNYQYEHFLPRIVDALKKEGLVTGNSTDDKECIAVLNIYACLALKTEKKCGSDSRNVFLEVMMKLQEAPEQCATYFPLLNNVVRIRREEEEEEEEGITALDICSKPSNCSIRLDHLPQTVEDFQRDCKSHLAAIDCAFSYFERCIPPEYESEEVKIKHGDKNRLLGIREICSENTFLHTAILDNFDCLKEFSDEYMKQKDCDAISGRNDRFSTVLVDALKEEGLVPENSIPEEYCILQMSVVSCIALKNERKCGSYSMNVFLEIFKKIEYTTDNCKTYLPLLKDVVRIRKEEENRNVLEEEGEDIEMIINSI